MTQIELLEEELQKLEVKYISMILEYRKEKRLIFEKAKEMHKQEIIDAYNKSFELRDKPYSTADKYYQETFVSKGSDEIELPKHPSVISENGNELLFDKEGNLIKELPKQETLYTEEQAIEFAKWLAANWFSIWVKDKFVWEHDWDKTREEQKYKGYYNEKELFNLFLSLKQPKKD